MLKSSIFLIFICNLMVTLVSLERTRTAVLMSGQLRVANISFSTGYIRSNNVISTEFDTDLRTPIQTVFDHFFIPLSQYTAIDLFIYIPASEGSVYDPKWNGDPITYVPYPGDLRACALYSNHPLFSQSTDNKVFCRVESEHVLSNRFVSSYKIWDSYVHRSHGRESYLRQEYGKYVTNLASKEYAIANGIAYTYKIRLRPDLAFRKNFTNILEMKYHDIDEKCPRAVYCANDEIMGGGAEDSFNYGEATSMDYVLDRYMDFLTNPVEHVPAGGIWMAGPKLKSSLERNGICLLPDPAAWIERIRVSEFVREYSTISMEKEQDWIDMKEHL